MTKAQRLVPDFMIEEAWGNADFGEGIIQRDLVDDTLLKYAAGYSSGHTAFAICMELGLLKMNSKNKVIFTALGKEYLYSAYSKLNT